MESCGTPTSIVLTPKFAAVVGPIVDPQLKSFRLEKT